LLDANGNQLAANDDYGDIPAVGQGTVVAYGLMPTDAREWTLVAELPIGSHTAILRGTAEDAGLVGIYDISRTRSSRFVNISTRARVHGEDNGVLIGGFISQRQRVKPAVHKPS
jgi:hypothetical protein